MVTGYGRDRDCSLKALRSRAIFRIGSTSGVARILLLMVIQSLYLMVTLIRALVQVSSIVRKQIT